MSESQEVSMRQDGSQEDDCKVIVLNYGKWKERKELEKLLQSHQIAFKKVQKARQLSYGFVVFDSPELREQALTQLPQLQWSGKNGEHLEVKAALPKKSLKPIDDASCSAGSTHNKRRKRPRHDGQDDDETNGHGNDEEDADQLQQDGVKDAQQVVTPWAHLPYEEQLARKEAEMKKVLVKIVRQTRKEYAKKEKRIAQEQRNIARKKKQKQNEEAQQLPTDGSADGSAATTATSDGDAKSASNTRRGAGLMTIPEWLNSNGSLYVIADEVLYTRHHEAQDVDEWKRLVDATGMQAIVSYGSQLVGANADGNLYSLELQEGKEPKWNAIGKTTNSTQITSLGSLRGVLLCCTGDGTILKLEHNGNLAVGEWKPIGKLESAAWITVHNGFVYACCTQPSSTTCTWFQAQMRSDVLDHLEFEPCPVALDGVLGMTSHDGQLILLKPNEMVYARQNGTVLKTVPLALAGGDQEQAVKQWMGLTSHKGLCCWMESIHASPQTDSYRNKCEFSIGFDADNKPCVGFRLGLFRDGSIVVSRPTDCVNVPEVMKQVCIAMESLIEVTKVPVYDLKTHQGVWRMVMVRYSQRTNQLMIMIQVNPNQMESSEKWDAFKKQIVDHLTSSSLPFELTSLYLHEYGGVSAPSEDDPVQKLHGEDYIQEELLGYKFNISPLAFFQVNTTGAEALYSLVHEQAQADEKTLLYDVCCGTGTIGICASKNVGKVVGIEICKAATEDADRNAKLNGVENVKFVNAKAEDVMRDLLQARRQDDEAHLDRVVAIVDPPRGGLHHQVLRALRSCLPLKRVVYVSCNPTNSLIQDAVTLCGPNTKSLVGTPFRPVHAVPVDMFPHTPHCEMVVVFDRQD